MKRFLLSVIVSCLGFVSSAHAGLVWNWSFANESIAITDPSLPYISIDVAVRNDAASTESLRISGFSLFDGSLPNLGVVMDNQGRPLITFSVLPQSTNEILPGTERVFTSMLGFLFPPAAVADAVNNRDSYVLDPNFYVLQGEGFNFVSRRASNPLNIQFGSVAIPEPNPAFLLLLGVPFVFLLASARLAQRKQLKKG